VINGRRWISTGFSVKEASKVGEKEHISKTLNCKFSHSGNLQNLAPAKTEQVHTTESCCFKLGSNNGENHYKKK
jgi:hypothetical protein